MTAVIKKRRPRALKTTSAAKKRKLARKLAAESTLRVVAMPPRVRKPDDNEDADIDQRAWLDW